MHGKSVPVPARPASRSLAARHDAFSPDKQRRFLELLAETASVARAALLVGVSRNTVYRLRNDPEAHDFRAGWEEALARAIDALTDIAFTRAVDGVEEPVYYRGEQVGVRQRRSDHLLMFLLARGQMFQPRMVARDKRTVIAVHDEGTFAASLDRIAPEAPLEPMPIFPPIAWPQPPLGPDPEDDEDAIMLREQAKVDAHLQAYFDRKRAEALKDVSLSSLSPGSTPLLDDGKEAAMKATIWHNPRCSKSRQALALLEEQGAEVTVIRYLEEPPTAGTLAALYARAGMTPAEGLRTSEEGAKALKGTDDATILAAMAADPILIERPLVETDKGVRLGRPPEKVLEIL